MYEIISACGEAGVKYAMIEQDDCYGRDEFDCLKKSLYIKKTSISSPFTLSGVFCFALYMRFSVIGTESATFLGV